MSNRSAGIGLEIIRLFYFSKTATITLYSAAKRKNSGGTAANTVNKRARSSAPLAINTEHGMNINSYENVC